jgi:cell division protease FtsH
MSRTIGPIAVLPADGQGPLLPGVSETSERTQQLVDEEVRRIVDSAYEEATEALNLHRANLDGLVAALLEHETLDEAEAYAAAGLERNPQAQPEEAPPVVS